MAAAGFRPYPYSGISAGKSTDFPGRPADHDGGAARRLEHVHRRRAVYDVAVSDDRDRDGFYDLPYLVQIGAAAVKLLPRPAVNGNSRRAGSFRPLSQFNGCKGIVVPSGTHFTVTGIDTAFTTAAMTCSALGKSFIKAEPSPF